MVVQIGIAMYRITNDNGRDSYFHWAVCLGKSLATDQMVTVHEIVRDSDAIDGGAWKKHFTFVNLRESGAFVGVLVVGTIDPDCSAIDSFIRENSPPVNHTGFTKVGPAVPWTCAVWVMHALLLLEESEVIDLPCTKDELYFRVLGRAEGLYTLQEGALFRGNSHCWVYDSELCGSSCLSPARSLSRSDNVFAHWCSAYRPLRWET